MSTESKLLMVGLVLIFAGPTLALIVWRWWRGEIRFYGFWVTPREFREKRREEERDARPPPGPQGR